MPDTVMKCKERVEDFYHASLFNAGTRKKICWLCNEQAFEVCRRIVLLNRTVVNYNFYNMVHYEFAYFWGACNFFYYFESDTGMSNVFFIYAFSLQ